MNAELGLPRGTVTFLFTDIEGSTALWERDREAMRAAVDRHIALLGEAIAAHGGIHFKTVGDAVQAAFHTVPAALLAAVVGQRAILSEPWPPEIGPLRVRMALHAGVAQPEAGDYLAPALNRLARMLGAGHGGQILASEAIRSLVSGDLPPEIVLRSLGSHRLRDLQEPEAIFQVVAPDVPDQFPPLRSLPHHPTNLPQPPTPLIDREAEVATATRLLRENEARLVTLTGPGGSGKTRLAVEVAAELLDAFPDGVFFVDLAALRDANLVVATVAATLGVREVAGEGLTASVAAFLGAKRLLLVLDNFEHVIEAAPALAFWLANCPAQALLVTSREPLRIRGERVLPLEPFHLPDDVDGLEIDEIAQIPAVALFVERAAAGNPAFALTAENAAAIVAICRRLDGLPLAIELAAARIRSFPPPTLLRRLERRLPILTGGARDLPERQRTLRDTIAWSHSLLDAAERALFRRMAVFSGGATLEALETIVNPDDDLDVLLGIDRLVEQHLVRLDERQGEPRYTMLETIREFAVEQLAASGEEARFRDRHGSFMLTVAEAAASSLPWEEMTDAGIAQMEREHENLRAALTWRLEQADTAGALRLGAALGSFWSWTNQWVEGRFFLERVLTLAPAGDPQFLARVVAYAGSFAVAQGDHRGAIALVEPGVPILDTPETRPWLLRILLKLAQALGQLREFERALGHYEGALDLAAKLDDRRSLLEVRWSMAYTATSQGALTRARELAEAILDDEGPSGDPLVLAGTSELLVWIALAADDLDRAAALLVEARAIAERAPRWAEGLRTNLLIDEAVLAYRRGDYARCAALVGEILLWARGMSSRQDLLLVMLLLASLAVHCERMADAARWFGALSAALADGEHWLHLEPAISPWHEADVALACQALGAVAFDRLWREGQGISLETALAEAEEIVCSAAGEH